MTHKSKCKSAALDDSYQTKDGKTMYKFWIEMENGHNGYYFTLSENQDKFKPNEEVEYEYTPASGDSHGKFKPYYNASSGGYKNSFKGGAGDPNKQELIVRQSCLNRALELCIHNSPEAKVNYKDVIALTEIMVSDITKNGELL
jgi:hypothetical protein